MINQQQAAEIRVAIFAAVFLLMAVWEMWAPKRPLLLPKGRRWASNLGLIGLDAMAVRWLAPFPILWLAHHVETQRIGLINQFALPPWAAVCLTIIALDLVIYLQHVLFHFLPILWRLHQVHHADRDIDVTTGLRFHPLEILLSLGIKMGAVYLLGAPVLAVVGFEVLLNATAMFNHSNVRLPAGLDAVLRYFLVTPDMHRVHHSFIVEETNSNFGFNLPIWDRLCGTYQAQPKEGHSRMQIGLREYRDAKVANLWWMLSAPLRKRPR